MSNRFIVINATATRKGGGLSILNQFLDNIPLSNYKWLLFVSPNLNLKERASNIVIKEIPNVTNFHKRLWWDYKGLKKYLKERNIECLAKISLQNTGFKTDKNIIPEFIYFHQSIPFYKKKWNPFKSTERSLFFYKHTYPFFIKNLLHKKTNIIVQLDYIKKGFIEKFKHPEENVKVFSPSFIPPVSNNNLQLSSSRINLFYPASDLFYKNHRVLYEALTQIDSLDNLYHLYLTIPQNLNKHNNITFLNSISYEKVCDYYHSVDALLFPSYIETFGLPLLEAASIGLPIIASDLPYAREVLQGYEGVKFVPYNDPEAWGNEILKLEKGKRYQSFNIDNRPGWKDLFNFIISKIEKNVDI